MTIPIRSKLDAPSRRRLAQLLQDGQSTSRQISLLVRGTGPFLEKQLDQLKGDGATIRTVAGAVCTIDVPLAAVDRVLQHQFIMTAQISSRFYEEQG